GSGGEARGLPSEGRGRVIIDALEPAIEGGAYAPKRVLGDQVTIGADLISDGHDLVAGELLLRRPAPPGELRPAGADTVDRALPLEEQGNDRFAGRFVADAIGGWQFAIRAWVDHFASFRRGLARKVEAGQ